MNSDSGYIFKRERTKATKLTKDEILADLRSYAEICQNRSFQTREYDKWKDRRITSSAISQIFGSWSKAMEMASLKPTRVHKLDLREMVEAYKHCWVEQRSEPTAAQFRKFLAGNNIPFSFKSYIVCFGSLGRLAQRIVDHQNGKIPDSQLHARYERAYNKKRIPPKLRHQVLERDGGKCVKCGRSPKTHPGVTLNAHHKIWEVDGGTTILENLETLCEDCHEGLHAQPKARQSARSKPDGLET
jgi:hypothetical protein